jgi:hypothetical protein
VWGGGSGYVLTRRERGTGDGEGVDSETLSLLAYILKYICLTYQCDERLKAKSEESTRLTYTG